MKDGEAARTEALAFHRVVAASGHYKPELHPRKKTKAMQDTLHGKRNGCGSGEGVVPTTCVHVRDD